jgi:hypothetical protein
MGDPIMDGLLCGQHKSRSKRAWLMGRATFWYSWGAPLPDDRRGGLCFALCAAWENFVGELTRKN